MNDHIARRGCSAKPIEHQLNRASNLFVGIEHELAVLGPQIADRGSYSILPALRLVPATSFHSLAQPDQLEVRHRPLHPQDEAIVRISRIINRLLVDQQRAGDRGDLEQAVPVSGRSRETRSIEAEHGADTAQSHFGDQTLKPLAVLREPTGDTKIVRDQLDGLVDPTQPVRQIHQIELSLGAGVVMNELGCRRLSGIDERATSEMLRHDLLMSIHRRLPRCLLAGPPASPSEPSTSGSRCVDLVRERSRRSRSDAVRSRPRRRGRDSIRAAISVCASACSHSPERSDPGKFSRCARSASWIKSSARNSTMRPATIGHGSDGIRSVQSNGIWRRSPFGSSTEMTSRPRCR
jgi:hypothetical protein